MRQVQMLMPDGSRAEGYRRYDSTGHDLYIDAPLANILMNYRQQGQIADRIMPIVGVDRQSGLFYQFTQDDLWRIPDTTRAPMTAAKRIDLSVSSQTFYCKNYALATGMSVEDMANADALLGLREAKGRLILDVLNLDYENRVAALCINASNVATMSTPTSGTNQSLGVWSDHTNADPMADVDWATENIRRGTGYRPNRMVIGYKAWLDLRRCDKIRSLLFPVAGNMAYAGPGVPTLNQVQQLFEMEQVLIGGLMKNTAAEGLGLTLADVWGPHVFIYYAPAQPSRETPSWGYSFRWNVPGVPSLQVEDLGYDRVLKGNLLEVGYYQDEKVTGAKYATVLQSVTAAA